MFLVAAVSAAGPRATIGHADDDISSEPTRPTNPNAISLEILGKAFLYSVNYDRALSDDFFAGLGIGSVTLDNADGSSSGRSAVMVPIYAGYYFIRDKGSPYVEIGAEAVPSNGVQGLKTSMGGMQFPSNPVLPFFGAGWETRTDSGFLFRVTGYGILGQSVTPWFGGSFGYAF